MGGGPGIGAAVAAARLAGLAMLASLGDVQVLVVRCHTLLGAWSFADRHEPALGSGDDEMMMVWSLMMMMMMMMSSAPAAAPAPATSNIIVSTTGTIATTAVHTDHYQHPFHHHLC